MHSPGEKIEIRQLIDREPATDFDISQAQLSPAIFHRICLRPQGG